MASVRVCRLEEFAPDSCRVVVAGRADVAVFRTADGLFALDDCCPHAGAPLSGGRVEAGTVTCPWHAWRFRLSDGAWADSPRVKTGSYPVRVDDGVVYVEVSDPSASPSAGGADQAGS